MPEYIKREDLENLLAHRTSGDHDIVKGVNLALSILDETLRSIPSADVAPVVHARWIGTVDDICSACGFVVGCGEMNCLGDANFCPQCGAKMDLK